MRKCITAYTSDDFVGWAAHQTVFSVACSLYEVIQTLKHWQHSRYSSKNCVPYPNKDIVLTPISFRCSRLVVPGMSFVAIWILVGLKSGEHADLLLLSYRCCITLHLNANLDRQWKP